MNVVILAPPELPEYTVKRFNEELHARGHDSQTINYLECYCGIGENRSSVYHKDKELRDIDAIIPLISINDTEFGVSLIRQFEMDGVFSMTGSLALSRARDKVRQLQIFSRSGISIPKSAFTSNSSDADTLISVLGHDAPLIAKVNRGSLGNGVMLLESTKSARSAIEAFHSQSISLLVQEYIEESGGKDIRAFVVDGEVAASILRSAAKDEFRSNMHQGGSPSAIKLTQTEEQLAIKAAKSMNLSVAGVDIIQSSRGPLITEVNACPDLERTEEATGVNLAGMIVDYIEKAAMATEPSKDTVGV